MTAAAIAAAPPAWSVECGGCGRPCVPVADYEPALVCLACAQLLDAAGVVEALFTRHLTPSTARPRQRVARCGTASGYKRHRRRSEPACAACKRAHADEAAFYANRPAAPVADLTSRLNRIGAMTA